MKVETIVLSIASALALAHPDAAQVALASAAVLASSRVGRRRKQRRQQKAPRQEPGRQKKGRSAGGLVESIQLSRSHRVRGRCGVTATAERLVLNEKVNVRTPPVACVADDDANDIPLV